MKDRIDEFINELIIQEKSNKTIVDYKHQLEVFSKWLETKEISKLTLIKYKEFLLNDEKIKAISSKNKNIVVVNKFVYWLGYQNLQLKQFKQVQKLSINNPLYPQEHKRMLRWSKKLLYEDIYLILKIFATTGCRCAELKFFTYENVSKTTFEIYNKGKARNIILIPRLKEEIIKYCKENNIKTGYIFTAPKDSTKILSENTIWRRLKKISKKAKINEMKIHPHSWRHLFAKEYVKLPGASVEELADILGHSKTETTRLYIRTSDREKQQRLEKMKFH